MSATDAASSSGPAAGLSLMAAWASAVAARAGTALVAGAPVFQEVAVGALDIVAGACQSAQRTEM